MGTTRQMNELDSEIERMESHYSKPEDQEDNKEEEGVDTTEEETSTVDDEVDNEEEQVTEDSSDLTGEAEEGESNDQDSDDQDQQKPNKKRKYTDWKTRYKSLRSHHDATAYDLRQELANLKSQMVSVNKQNMELQKQVVVLSQKSGVDDLDLTEEEREVLGDEAIAALSKATKSAVGPIKKQLDEERQRRLQEQESSAKHMVEENKRMFIDRFSRLVPNYVTIDKDAKFLQFMQQVDPASGYERTTLFRKAVNNGDVVRAAGFYQEYLSKQKLKQGHLANKVTPTGKNIDTSSQRVKQQGQKETISRKFIDKYYDDVVRGRYKGKESLAKEIETKIENAILEGRVK